MLQAILDALTGAPGISIIAIGVAGTALAAVLGQVSKVAVIGALIAGGLGLLGVAFVRQYYTAGGVAL